MADDNSHVKQYDTDNQIYVSPSPNANTKPSTSPSDDDRLNNLNTSISTPPPPLKDDEYSLTDDVYYTPHHVSTDYGSNGSTEDDSKKGDHSETTTNHTYFTATSDESLFSDKSSDKTLTESTSQLDDSSNSNSNANVYAIPCDRGDLKTTTPKLEKIGSSDEQGMIKNVSQEGIRAERSMEESESINNTATTESEFSESEGSEDDGLDTDLDVDDATYSGAFLRRERSADPQLPSTVTKLETADGGKVYLVGTAHFSIESQDDVAKTIQVTQPDAVMVELCKGRVNILQLDEKTVLEEAKNINLEKIRSAIRQSGVVQGAMYLLLLSMSAHLTKELGMAPGGEFRRAFSEAKRVPGCLIHLGDRPIRITLQRALAALSLWQKIRLAWYMITCKEPISKEEVERCKQRDLLEELLAEMTGEFPALSRVFVTERDIYLTHSLQLAVKSVSGSHARKCGDSFPAVVVGVVGIGHVPGIVENWGRISEVDIPPLLQIPEASLAGKIVRYSFRASLIGLVAWGCWRTLPWQRITNIVTSNVSVLTSSLRHSTS